MIEIIGVIMILGTGLLIPDYRDNMKLENALKDKWKRQADIFNNWK